MSNSLAPMSPGSENAADNAAASGITPCVSTGKKAQARRRVIVSALSSEGEKSADEATMSSYARAHLFVGDGVRCFSRRHGQERRRGAIVAGFTCEER